MNKAKAMLDALMGPSRDTSSKNVTADDWKDRKVCRTFLVAVCPYDKTMLGGRKGSDVCPKIHNPMLRDKFNAHSDGAPDSSFRRRCEDAALRELSEVIVSKDQWAREQVSRKNAILKIRPTGQNKDIGKMKRTVCDIKEKADLIDDEESMASAALKASLLKEYAEGLAEYESFVKDEEKKQDALCPRAQSCKVCGTAYEKEQDYDLHLTYTRHTSFVQIQEHFDSLKEKAAEWEKNEKAKKTAGVDNGDVKKVPKDIGREEKGKKRSQSRDKDKTKDKEENVERRSKSEKKDKAGDKDKDGDKSKKSGDNTTRSRERERARDKDKARDRRSGDRDKRRRDGSRDRGAARKRSRSRSRKRSRDRDRRR